MHSNSALQPVRISSHGNYFECGISSAIERILERLEQYRCECCGQICIVPHVRILARSRGSRPVCKGQVPPATGFSVSARPA
jgi:galactokinase